MSEELTLQSVALPACGPKSRLPCSSSFPGLRLELRLPYWLFPLGSPSEAQKQSGRDIQATRATMMLERFLGGLVGASAGI